MINNKKKDLKKDSLVRKVVNIKNHKINEADIDAIKSKIIENPTYMDPTVKEASKDLVANYIKGSIALEQPKYYDYFKNMPYDELMKNVTLNKAGNEMLFNVPGDFAVDVNNGGTLNQTSFSISQNSFWSNVTNILNVVSVGDNIIDTGESFNAWDFFHSQTLASGEAVLRTMGTPLSGTFLLNQNNLVPSNTQMAKGYQASLGVFINTDSVENVGGGTGIGLFNMYSVPINVLKLAVTNPQQFAEMVRIFQATAQNSKRFTLWVTCTLNMLQNISNIIVDNYNNNIRNCLNGTLFPAIQIMKNPTNEFNCGLVGTYGFTGLTSSSNALNNATTTQITYNSLSDTTQMNSLQYTARIEVNNSDVMWNNIVTGNPTDSIGATTNTSNSGYYFQPVSAPQFLVPGSESMPRIQSMSASDMYLIVSPEFLVGLKSGTLSQLFHYEFQRLEEYIKPDHIMMLYKTINIPAGYLNDQITNTNNQIGYAQQVRATLGDRWIPKNVIYLVTKPKDENMWTANYGDVWTTEMSNTWGAGMIGTSFLQYAFWGGVIPWANGCGFYFKNLMTLISDDTAAVMTDFTLGALAVQATIANNPGTGQN